PGTPHALSALRAVAGDHGSLRRAARAAVSLGFRHAGAGVPRSHPPGWDGRSATATGPGKQGMSPAPARPAPGPADSNWALLRIKPRVMASELGASRENNQELEPHEAVPSSRRAGGLRVCRHLRTRDPARTIARARVARDGLGPRRRVHDGHRR